MEFNKMDWHIEDDRVMGGVSQGNIKLSGDVMIFSGILSLENNGGFSSVQSGPLAMDLSETEGLALVVKGDGRTYQMRVATDATYRGREMGFTAPFQTKAGEWITVRIPFADFVGTFRGKSLPNREFDPSKVRRLRILLGDRNPGSFELEIDAINTYSGSFIHEREKE